MNISSLFASSTSVINNRDYPLVLFNNQQICSTSIPCLAAAVAAAIAIAATGENGAP
jgi:hypothetical protein